MILKKYFLILLILASCTNPKNQTEIDRAVEIICPGAPNTLVLRATKKELREALRKQYSHHRTRDTALKLKDGSIILLPSVRPRDLNKCLLRSIPKLIIPTSQGY